MFNFAALGITKTESQKVILKRVSDKYLEKMIELEMNKKMADEEIFRRRIYKKVKKQF